MKYLCMVCRKKEQTHQMRHSKVFCCYECYIKTINVYEDNKETPEQCDRCKRSFLAVITLYAKAYCYDCYIKKYGMRNFEATMRGQIEIPQEGWIPVRMAK